MKATASLVWNIRQLDQHFGFNHDTRLTNSRLCHSSSDWTHTGEVCLGAGNHPAAVPTENNTSLCSHQNTNVIWSWRRAKIHTNLNKEIQPVTFLYLSFVALMSSCRNWDSICSSRLHSKASSASCNAETYGWSGKPTAAPQALPESLCTPAWSVKTHWETQKCHEANKQETCFSPCSAQM